MAGSMMFTRNGLREASRGRSRCDKRAAFCRLVKHSPAPVILKTKIGNTMSYSGRA